MKVPGYKILCTIGNGGTAVVYLANDRVSGDLAVLKVLKSGVDPRLEEDCGGETLSIKRRFSNEADLLATLRHPNIIRVHGGAEVDGIPYIAMEYLDGGDLESLIASGMEPGEALAITRAMADALSYAHQRGVLHRDVKPRNILFRDTGQAVLTDFGMAKHLEQDMGVTATGVVMGTPYYMSPEHAGGDAVDGRTDIYSLGVILFEMLAGKRPFEGPSAMSILMQHVVAPIPELPERCAFLQSLLSSMLAKEPEKRPGSASLLVRKLDAILERLGKTGAVHSIQALPTDRPGPSMPEALLNDLYTGIQLDLDCDRLVLPSLPEVAIRIRQELDSPTASAAGLSKLIKADPALSTQLLRIANSSFYAGTQPVKDLQSAIVKLGNDVVCHVVMMLVVGQLFHAKSENKLLREMLREVWRHSIFVAVLSESIARDYTELEPDVAMLAGLIHDIGVMPALGWAIKIPHLGNSKAKLQRFVAESHGEIGAAILVKWNYPEELVAVVRDHERHKCDQGQSPEYLDVVVLANRLANAAEKEDGETGTENVGECRIGEQLLTEEDIAELMGRGREGAESLRAAIS